MKETIESIRDWINDAGGMLRLAFTILVVFAMVDWVPLSLFLMLCLGVALLLIINLANILLQTLVSDNLRGRE